uniref:Uncharacterized protein n=1 Tax=Globisporangium ultimum (strain ATCC 200006 / CBS 805.95 / DAOM BR144) TaxID=431595 RepID=K3WS37_GLOUD
MLSIFRRARASPDARERELQLQRASVASDGHVERTEERLVGPLPPTRKRRYRSRNCRNFKRYGDLFQFVEASGGATGGERRGRVVLRSARAQNRRLTQEVQEMQQRVLELQHQRDLLQSEMVNSYENAIAHAMDMTKNFYMMFENGYDPVKTPVHAQTAAQFLRAVMDEDVVCTEFRGVDLFLRQYEVCCQGHESMKVSLKGLTLISDSANDGAIQIYAHAVATLRINRETLLRFFPRIINDEELTQQLIGREYMLQYDKVFHFQDGHIFQHESRVDLCNGILDLVKDPFVAMKLLEASLMTKHGHLKIDHHIEEDQHSLANQVL